MHTPLFTMKNLSNPLFAVLLLTAPAAVLSAESNAAEPKIIEPAISTSTAVAPTDVVISAVGDIMLDGTARPVMTEQGYDYPFVKMLPYFSGAQIVFGNVEGPLTDRGTPEQDKTYVFRSPPAKVGAALRTAGFNVVSLANNHTLDYGADGLIRPLKRWTRQASFIRSRSRPVAARQPAVLQANGQRVAILAYSMTLPESFCRRQQGGYRLWP